MNKSGLLAIAVSVGLVAGVGGTWLAVPKSSVKPGRLQKPNSQRLFRPILLCALFRKL